jgi:hypothetical protein
MEMQQIVSTEFEKICLNKFLISIKDEFTKRFNDFIKNNKEKIIKEIEMVEKNKNNPEKKKRGRPKKPKTEILKTEEKEPEILKLTEEKEPEILKELEKEPEILKTEEKEPEMKPKKKRGRPKKVKPDDIIITSVNDTDDELVTNNIHSKKKGRPALKEQHNIIEVNTEKEPVCDIQEIDVIRIDINGDIYLRDTYNNLYNMSDQEPVGKYDELNNAIIV